MEQPFAAGDTVTAYVTRTDGVGSVETILVDAVDRTGCGCWRLRGFRPGPVVTGAFDLVELLSGCAAHEHWRTGPDRDV